MNICTGQVTTYEMDGDWEIDDSRVAMDGHLPDEKLGYWLDLSPVNLAGLRI